MIRGYYPVVKKIKHRRIIPGFGLSMGITITYLSVLILLPMAALTLKTIPMGWDQFWKDVWSPRVIESYKITFGASLIAALINFFMGGLAAWVLTRYNFFGRRLIDSMIDLPFALPTAVAGITLATIYAPNGWIGQYFAPESFLITHLNDATLWIVGKEMFPNGIAISFSEIGIVIALTFIGLPFIVRTVQPILEDLDQEVEEAAGCLGANRWQIATRVILPEVFPALITGFALAFARAIGEYGSVVFIAGNIPFKTEITPLLIITRLEQYDYAGATALGFSMLAISFVMLLIINILQHWNRSRFSH